jgi:hypothetical protein
MHPLFMEKLAADRQCDLYGEAKAANGPAHVGSRLRRLFRRPSRERDRSTVHVCS